MIPMRGAQRDKQLTEKTGSPMQGGASHTLWPREGRAVTNKPTDEQILDAFAGTNQRVMTYVIRNHLEGIGFKGLTTGFVRRRLIAMELAGIVKRAPSSYATQICWQKVDTPAAQEGGDA